MTVAHKAEFTALLIYGLISTVMQVLTTPIIVEEFISFFRGLWNGVTGYFHLANDAEKGMASIADYIEYYGAAEPPVRCGVSHLSGQTEPLCE